ncbi:MAG: DUF167 family protein [Thermoplasmatales archaeon]|nr:DUF167 family protein [Thermoplasmatales archaeon]
MSINEAVRKASNGVLIDVEVVLNSATWNSFVKFLPKNLRLLSLPCADKESISFDPWRKRIKLKVKGKALKGEANNNVLVFFSKLFDRKVKIFSGEHSRKKTVFVENINPDDAVRKAGKW